MKVLFLGDIVGKKGREVIRDLLPVLKDKYQPDFVIANGENSAHGKGITYRIYKELLGYGVNTITLGNHSFSKKEILEYLDDADKLICPINHVTNQGKGYRIFNVSGETICVINCLGLYDQEDYATSPYLAMEKALNDISNLKVDYILVDLHAEATAEKRVFVEYFKNRVSAVIGTHTHVQTADEQIINGVGFITDVGMCGPYNSIIGRDVQECINRMVKNMQTKYTVSLEKPLLCGVFLEFKNKKCSYIERIQIKPKSSS